MSDPTDAIRRGECPPDAFGESAHPVHQDALTSAQIDALEKKLTDAIGGFGERQVKRHQVMPYLLVRAAAGDHGGRPTWPPVPCWESPDILINPEDASPDECDLGRLVLSPVQGKTYRIWVRVWNLGRMRAEGVLVTAWIMNPGFIGDGDPEDQEFLSREIGMGVVDLADRTQAGCVALVPVQQLWTVGEGVVGHSCLVVRATTLLDSGSGRLISNADRHVGQRNLTVLSGGDTVFEKLKALDPAPDARCVVVMHAGGLVRDALRGIGNIDPTVADGTAVSDMRTRAGTPLVIAHEDRHGERRAFLAQELAERLADFRDPHVYEDGTRVFRALENTDPDTLEQIAPAGSEPMLTQASSRLRELLQLPEEENAALVAEALGDGGAWHGLRVAAYGRVEDEAVAIGGYTFVVTGDQPRQP